jgi:pimeloyl-ACP methyl ester carboxylesterase
MLATPGAPQDACLFSCILPHPVFCKQTGEVSLEQGFTSKPKLQLPLQPNKHTQSKVKTQHSAERISMKIPIKLVCLTILVIFSSHPIFAQNAPVPGTDAAERANQSLTAKPNQKNRAGMTATMASLAVRSSPFEPPEDSDRSFSTDSGPGLDTGCSFRSEGPLIFNIEIKRFIGELNADGTLKNANALIAAGAISPKVKLIMPNYDVDSDASFPGIAPERDRVSVNGEEVGYLEGANNQWMLNSFEIDVRKIKFAAAGGSEPAGGVNEIRIDIDTANSEEYWCTSTDWGSSSFRALSPIIFIHGNGSNGGFFTRQGFTAELDARGLEYNNSINLATAKSGSDFIANNARELNEKLPRIIRSLGSKTVHLIAHSKGGLDTRAYLADFQRNYQRQFKILSLTTLSTPHDGSVLADVSVERREAADQVGYTGKIDYEGFPRYMQQLLAVEQLMGLDDGRRNLTTGFVAGFNQNNLPRLDGLGVTFNTIAADADTNSNGQMDRNPDEYFHLRAESGSLNNIDRVSESASRYIVDTLYQILRKTRGVNVRYRDQCVTRFGPCRKIATITSIDNASLLGNDTLVTIPSARGANSIQSRTTNSRTFSGGNGKNHSNVADREVARAVIPWLFEIERRNGGLR